MTEALRQLQVPHSPGASLFFFATRDKLRSLSARARVAGWERPRGSFGPPAWDLHLHFSFSASPPDFLDREEQKDPAIWSASRSLSVFVGHAMIFRRIGQTCASFCSLTRHFPAIKYVRRRASSKNIELTHDQRCCVLGRGNPVSILRMRCCADALCPVKPRLRRHRHAALVGGALGSRL